MNKTALPDFRYRESQDWCRCKLVRALIICVRQVEWEGPSAESRSMISELIDETVARGMHVVPFRWPAVCGELNCKEEF